MQSDAKSATANLIRGWEVVIGLEVHAQVASKAKLFSGASTAFGGEPNSHVSLVDAAMPGMLPVINEECVAQAVRTGLGLKAQINLRSRVRPQELLLSRPAAGLPDLASTSSRSSARARSRSTCRRRDASTVGIERLHLEQDAGKSIHDQHPDHILRRPQPLGRGADGDRLEARHALGRRGAGLRDQAAHDPALSRHLRRRHGEGQPARRRQRLGAPARATTLGTRCEIKNVNSIRFIGQAIEYEARRQIDILEDGGTIEQETRLFDPRQGRDALDALQGGGARLPLLPRSRPAAARARRRPTSTSSSSDLPELPDAKKARFIERLRALAPTTPACWSPSARRADFFEAVAKGRDGKAAANWVINELFGRLNKEGKDIDDSRRSRPRSSAASST